MVSTLEQMQVQKGKGPGVRRRRRPLLASRARCKCSIYGHLPEFGNHAKVGIIILQNKTLDLIGRELVTWRETTVMYPRALGVVSLCYRSHVMLPRCRNVSLGLSTAAIVTKGYHHVVKNNQAMSAFICCDAYHLYNFYYKSNEDERKVTLAHLLLWYIFKINTGSKLQIICVEMTSHFKSCKQRKFEAEKGNDRFCLCLLNKWNTYVFRNKVEMDIIWHWRSKQINSKWWAKIKRNSGRPWSSGAEDAASYKTGKKIIGWGSIWKILLDNKTIMCFLKGRHHNKVRFGNTVTI